MVHNSLTEGQVLYVLSDRDVYESSLWNTEGLLGGVDGCVITGGSQAQPQAAAPVDNPGEPAFVAVQGGGGKSGERHADLKRAKKTFLTIPCRGIDLL